MHCQSNLSVDIKMVLNHDVWRGRKTSTQDSDMREQSMPELPAALVHEKHELSNGMRVVICRRPHLHRICLLLNVASGCRDEHLPGTAHMLEHLVFRGSKNHPSLRLLSEAFEACGADFNAYTAREVTSYDVSMPAESLGNVLSLLGEVICGPRLSGIASERDIIREEILSDYDADNSLINVDDLLVSQFYGEAGRPIAGDPDDLAKISRSEVVAFYEAHYAAPNMLLVMTGPIGPTQEVLDVLESSFRNLRREFNPWRRRAMPEIYFRALTENRRTEPRLCLKKYDGATQSEVLLGFLTPAAGSAAFPAIEMLVRVLDDGMASRLSRRLVEECALVYDTEAFISTTQESTLLQIRATCRHRRVARVLGAVYELIREIARDGIEDAELDRLRKRVIWEHLGMLDGVAQLAQWLSSMILQDMPSDIRVRCQKLVSVSGEDIRAAAEHLLESCSHIAAIVGDIGDRGVDEIRETMKQSLNTGIGVTVI